MTPLLDVVFLLLVFFLVSTSFVKPEKSIDIKLPTAQQAAEPPSERHTVVVNVRENGLLVVDQRVLSGSEDLEQTLRHSHKANPDLTVVIYGDRSAAHKHIVKVMNAALKVGIEDMSIAVFDTEDDE